MERTHYSLAFLKTLKANGYYSACETMPRNLSATVSGSTVRELTPYAFKKHLFLVEKKRGTVNP